MIAFEGAEKIMFRYLRLTSQANRGNALEVVQRLVPALNHFSAREIMQDIHRTITDVARCSQLSTLPGD
jgi:hypothetical protein